MHTLIVVVFVLGYLAIALEHKIKVNKAASALLIGVVCWALYVVNLDAFIVPDSIPSWFQMEAMEEGVKELPLHYAIDVQHLSQTGEIASILLFLMGAMTIVELVDSHEAFALITDRIRTTSKRTLLWLVAFLTFSMSAILDNLTTTIVMVSLLKKLVRDREDRLRFVGLVVIAANAGGAWTVIGDVTTTMLRIQHKIGTVEVMQELFVGSLVCVLVPLIGFTFSMSGTLAPVQSEREVRSDIRPWHQWVFLILGLAALLGVPVFKTLTHLPPYMGMMLSLSVLWIVSELVGHTLNEETRSTTGVLAALKRVDMSSILFFLGILLAVGCLGATGTLQSTALWLDQVLPNRETVAIVIGLVSSVVDNVPLVAAGMEMYSFPMNDPFWMLLAYCAGTGGSSLIIGSAAGVAAMGLEHIDFLWYLRRVAFWAVVGYLAGAVVVVATL
ncbi:sodium:proton antiporter NhaD [Aporhodopirellula aestuarii]|uniref:Sodium:proton antiporter NhaD n=1 Tax=Aporhodopirellula aestuarii TaxID=2950107 RepID=A0ABT0UAE8_9BACT|nr:sodium:proton antiporter NhaD [Aporhodopirellula aestuarii]MCM2373746.1 sodium:proton antiporter NhaD [Aporhodopirellula aestuarii]